MGRYYDAGTSGNPWILRALAGGFGWGAPTEQLPATTSMPNPLAPWSSMDVPSGVKNVSTAPKGFNLGNAFKGAVGIPIETKYSSNIGNILGGNFNGGFRNTNSNTMAEVEQILKQLKGNK